MDYKADINQSAEDNANLKKILAEGESDIKTGKVMPYRPELLDKLTKEVLESK